MGYDYETRILESGENYIHGSLYYNGYLWFSTRTNPALAIKMDPSDLTYSKITLTDLAGGECIAEAGNYIWVPIQAGNPSTLVKINPETLSWEVVATFTGFFDAQSVVYAFGYLWIGGREKIARVDITDNSYTLYDYAADTGDMGKFHAITSGNGYLWATTGTLNKGRIFRINPSTPTDYTYVDIGEQIPDDIAFLNGYLYLGTETSASRIYKLNGNDPNDYVYSEIGDSVCYGPFAHNNKIWAGYVGSPGIVRVISRTFLTVEQVIDLPTGYDSANEIVFDENDNIFVTCWMAPARVVKLTPTISGREYKIEGGEFATLMDTFRRGFKGNPTFDVTYSALCFGDRDPVTGWYAKNYAESTIKMVVIQKESQNMALRMGYYVSLDALGFTLVAVEAYGLITDNFGRTWEVKTVKPIIVGHTLKYFVCDLKEMPLHV